MFKPFKSFNPSPFFEAEPGECFLPRVAGEEQGEGLNGAQRLNDLNGLNDV